MSTTSLCSIAILHLATRLQLSVTLRLRIATTLKQCPKLPAAGTNSRVLYYC
jgi:hypothetical protein